MRLPPRSSRSLRARALEAQHAMRLAPRSIDERLRLAAHCLVSRLREADDLRGVIDGMGVDLGERRSAAEGAAHVRS